MKRSRLQLDMTPWKRKGFFWQNVFSHLRFCQMQIQPNFLSNMWFCQTISNVFLSKLVNVLSNTGNYIDKLHCLTEFFCVWQKFFHVLVLFDRTTQKCVKNRKIKTTPIQMIILKNPPDKSCKIIFRNFCQEDFTIGPLFLEMF